MGRAESVDGQMRIRCAFGLDGRPLAGQPHVLLSLPGLHPAILLQPLLKAAMADVVLGLIEKLTTLSSLFYGRPGRLSCSVVEVVDFIGERGQVRWTTRVL